MASGTVNVILMVHEFVIDIGFPMQEAVTNHPTHEAEGTRSHFNAVFSFNIFTTVVKHNRDQRAKKWGPNSIKATGIQILWKKETISKRKE